MSNRSAGSRRGGGAGAGAGTVRAYLTLTAGGRHTGTELGTLRLLLRHDVVPRTVENFTSLLSRPSPRGYRGCPFHRLIKGFMIQGGDFTEEDGTGGTSIYGKNFSDENFALGHDGRGILSMANSGPNTNGSQFFINFRPTPHLDGRHVVFGTVDIGDKESVMVLDKLEGMRTDGDDRPLVEVRISDCGVVEEKETEGVAAGTAAAEAGGDDDEIDLDDDDDDDDDGDDGGPKKPQGEDDAGPTADANPADDEDEIDLDEDEIDNPSAPPVPAPETSGDGSTKKLSKKAALRARLRSLKTRMNQSRALNRREVRSEGERLGSEEGMKREKRRLKKEERERRDREWKEANGRALGAGAVKEGEEKYMAESADASLRRAARKAEKARANRFEANDYYNPEGQHRNYERGLKSVSASSTAAAAAAASGASSTYDPLHLDRPTDSSLASERAGAARLASELRRRHEKATSRKRDREVEFDAADVSGINQRNKRFNEKIGRNFDRHTAEIRQNLERGTAL